MRPPRTTTRPRRRSRIPGPSARALCAVIALTMAWSASGCRLGGPRNFENENDRLRRVILELEDDIQQLENDRAELRAKLDEARRDRAITLPEEVMDAIPRVSTVEIGRLSSVDTTADGSPIVVVNIRPLDGRRRFVQAVGTMRIEALALPPGVSPEVLESDREAGRALARASLGPAALREAYTGGLVGSVYTVELPFTPVDWDARAEEAGPDAQPEAPSADPGDRPEAQPLPIGTTLVLRVEFEDAITGRTHRAERMRTIGRVERLGPTPSRMRRPDE